MSIWSCHRLRCAWDNPASSVRVLRETYIYSLTEVAAGYSISKRCHAAAAAAASFRKSNKRPSGRRQGESSRGGEEKVKESASLTRTKNAPSPSASSTLTATTTVTTKVQSLSNANTNDFVKDWMIPVRYRFPRRHQFYSQAQGWALAYRLPLLVGLAVLISWDETAPFTLVRIRGPSMLPTMAADGSDIWLCRRGPSWSSWCSSSIRAFFATPDDNQHYHKWNSLSRGDIVGFGPPNDAHTSCKRVVGLPGDVVQRYGQYVHLYVPQDPDNWGLTWPTDEAHAWIDRSCPWDVDSAKLPVSKQSYTDRSALTAAKRTLVVPPGHVWLEADCPGLGIDSRQMGPIPMDWVQGVMVARLWPLASHSHQSSWKQRPHPMRLDRETLQEHNVYRAS